MWSFDHRLFLLGYNQVSFYILSNCLPLLYTTVAPQLLCILTCQPTGEVWGEDSCGVTVHTICLLQQIHWSQWVQIYFSRAISKKPHFMLACCLTSLRAMNPSSRPGGFRSLHPQRAYRSPQSLAHISQAPEWVGRELHPRLGRGFLPSEVSVLLVPRGLTVQRRLLD